MLYIAKTIFKPVTISLLLWLLLAGGVQTGWCDLGKTGVITSAKWLNVRRAPNTSSARIMTLKKGSKVTVLAYVDKWIEIEYDIEEVDTLGDIIHSDCYIKMGSDNSIEVVTPGSAGVLVKCLYLFVDKSIVALSSCYEKSLVNDKGWKVFEG